MPFLPPNQQRQSTEGIGLSASYSKWCGLLWDFWMSSALGQFNISFVNTKNTKLEICMHSVNELNLPTDFIITQKVIKSVNFNDKLKSCITLTLLNSNLQQLWVLLSWANSYLLSVTNMGHIFVVHTGWSKKVQITVSMQPFKIKFNRFP